jgi:predicted DNA-binding transcriptional regulator AlpA
MTRRAALSLVAEPGTPPEAIPLPPGVVHISKPAAAVVERLALRLEEVAAALGVSRRALERERAAGRFPKPDLILGRRMPLWRPETIRRWAEEGGRP